MNETPSPADNADKIPPTDYSSPLSPLPEPDSTVGIPEPQLDDELEKEVEQALGDISLMDLYGSEKIAKPQKSPPAVSGNLPPGVTQGMVISIDEDGAIVNLGGKSEGFLPREEWVKDQILEVGSKVNVSVIRYDNRDGLLILSLKTADQHFLRRDLKVGALVEARVTGSNKGGLEMDIKGLKAFMPLSQIDLVRVDDTNALIGQKFVCQVIQVEHDDRNIVLSRRNVLEEEQKRQSEKTWELLEPGQLRHGVVRSLTDYGAFVDIGGIDGLLHIREMSWSRIKHPRDILAVGQAIDVKIIDINKENKRISLSLRQAGGDPWTTAPVKYPVGSRHQARVMKLMDFGVFAELAPGVDGLIPISEMTWAGRIRHPSYIVKAGALVDVEILKVDADKRRIALSMKNLLQNPWLNVAEKYLKDHIYTGTVARLTEFGAFVTLENGIDGLLHISEISDKRLGKASDVLRQGEQVRVKVIGVDPENQRISLSMKMPPAEETTPSSRSPQTQTHKKTKDRPRRGGLTF